MTLKKRLAEKTGMEEEILPSSYQIIGNVLLIKFMKIRSLKQKKAIAKEIINLLPYVKTVCEIRGIGREFRIPIVRKLLGKNTETIHKEHGILYKLDASKIMFSKGNLFERQRLISKVKKDEIIVDMFAGIGYFSLPLSKKCAKVYAIEKNPVAYRYLKENIKLNKIKNIEPIVGECRHILKGKEIKEEKNHRFVLSVDHIIMGYFSGTEKFLPYALKMLKNGGVIHFHNTYRESELWEKPISDLRKHIKKFKILNKKIVKSVGPRNYHIVIDLKVNS